jgi:outer membrane protein assembly factor BamB
MWRFNQGRGAASPENLSSPEELSLAWERVYSPREMVWDDPLNHDLMQFDRIFEPVVHQGIMVIGFNDYDKVVGLDAETGSVTWTFYADGPVRLAPATWKGKVYFTSDDGHLYCLNINNGELIWKKRGGPDERLILGNKRLISAWPARGGAVIQDGVVYWAASIWPFMGTYIYATDAETGNTLWLNDGTGSSYILQPHNSPAFAGVAPQGNLAISGNNLLVPGGRTVPAAYDLKTGDLDYYRLADNGKNGGAFVCADDTLFFNHNRDRQVHVFNSADGALLEKNPGKYPVLAGNKIFYSGSSLKVADKSAPAEITSEIEVDATGDLIMAGSRLYAAGKKGITVLESVSGDGLKITGFIPVRGGVERLLTADQQLFAVSIDGTIRAFSKTGDKPSRYDNFPEPFRISPETADQAAQILESSGVTAGWALVYGAGNGELPAALSRKSSLDIIVIEPDNERIAALRKKYDMAGITTEKVSFINITAGKSLLPPYMASLTIITDDAVLKGRETSAAMGLIHNSMRPFGGTLWISESAPESARLFATSPLSDFEGLKPEQLNGRYQNVYLRSGAPKGSANWTQQYGSMANTVKSDDALVQLPLGVLWFGGNSNMDVLPRHGHGPPEQVVDGNLIIEGMNSITCRDVYTGRVNWKTEFTALGTVNQYYDESYADLPLGNYYYNQEHLPGSNSRGTNFVVTPKEVFVAQGTYIHILDMEDGRITKSVNNSSNSRVGFIGVYQDRLITGTGFASYSDMISHPPAKPVGLEPIKPSDKRKVKRFTDYDITASAGLSVYDSNAEILWHKPAEYGFIHNTITAGNNRIYLIDAVAPAMQNTLSRRGINIYQKPVLMVLDPDTGETIWSTKKDVFGSWLGYSEEYDLLLQATRPSRDMISGEEGTRMIVYEAETGKILWDKELKYANPPIIHGDRVIVENGGFNLKTGETLQRNDPITGEQLQWTYTREYGCNYNIASEHLLSFRSAAAGFYDLDNKGGTGNFGGFKSSCTSNLIAANGVLNAPDYTRTCSCSYQNQTSLALVHMPELEYWTTNDSAWSGAAVQKLGLNLGAPGDRMAENGTLWLEYPMVGGLSPEIPVTLAHPEETKMVTHNALNIKKGSLPWVAASGLEGLTDLEIQLAAENHLESDYSVTLYFAELDSNVNPGDRVFDVAVQGKTIREKLDIVRETGGCMLETSITIPSVSIRDNVLRISLKPQKGSRKALLNGIHIEQAAGSR